MASTVSSTTGFFYWPSLENICRLPPPQMPQLAPPKSFKHENSIQVLRRLRPFFIMGGPIWDSIFFNRLVTGQHLAFKEGPVKKHPFYFSCYSNPHPMASLGPMVRMHVLLWWWNQNTGSRLHGSHFLGSRNMCRKFNRGRQVQQL